MEPDLPTFTLRITSLDPCLLKKHGETSCQKRPRVLLL
jgi:hypothetical protein